MISVFVEYVAVYDCVFDSFRGHHQAASAAGQIVLHPRAFCGADSMLVENRDVGGKSGLETAAIPDSEEVGRLRGDTLDRLLQGHRSAFADPGAEQISAVAGVAEHVHMRAAVGETDHGARI